MGFILISILNVQIFLPVISFLVLQQIYKVYRLVYTLSKTLLEHIRREGSIRDSRTLFQAFVRDLPKKKQK